MKQFWFVLLLFSATVAQAQVAKTAPPKSNASTEAELELKERRARARSLLVALSTDARQFHDQTLRARSLARIADALWQVDAEQGRLLFRKAWEAAETGDQESDRKLQQEISQQKSRTGGYAVNLPPNLRREVLKLAARHDRVLGEEFLEKLKTQKLEAANSATTSNPSSGRLSEALSQRIGLAKELLKPATRSARSSLPDQPSQSSAGKASTSWWIFARRIQAPPILLTPLCWRAQLTMRKRMQIQCRRFRHTFSRHVST